MSGSGEKWKGAEGAGGVGRGGVKKDKCLTCFNI